MSDADQILDAIHPHPHKYLGMHQVDNHLVVRAFVQHVVECSVVDVETDKRYPLKKVHESGLFEGKITGKKECFRYRLRTCTADGEVRQFYDPYSFLPTLNAEDVYLFNEGTNHRAYRFLGSHRRYVDGVHGIAFAVWAPSAKRVSLVGDFNRWDGRYYPMRPMGSSGVWEIFIPGMEVGLKYKYEMIDANNNLVLKSDPYALYYESPPNNASITCDIEDYRWEDAGWLEARTKINWKKKPISIYEVHLGSWKRVVEDGNRSLTYREAAVELTDYVKKMGYTHVEFLPLAEHPFAGSWGYQVTGFFAPTHRHGTPQDFMFLVDTLHQNGIGVLVDWVPAHFPKDSFALARFDGTCLYEHADPRQGEHQDWGTLIFNYGRKEVNCFLVGSALSWLDRFHIDGLRVDAVASMLYLDYSRKDGEWIPNQYGGHENIEAIEFLRATNDLIHHYYPGAITIAEESTAFGRVSQPTTCYGLGFDFKWNMGWMHDTLEYFKKDPLFRKYYHNQLTFGMLYQYSEHFINVFSHDEVVHGKGSMIMKMGSWFMSEKAQTLRALYAYMWMWPGKNTLFMGCDFGQSSEWYYDASLDWHLLQHVDHSGIQKVVADINKLYREHSFLAENDYNGSGFQWVNPDDGDNSVLSFLRLGATPQETMLVICNFTPVARSNYLVGVPHGGQWREILNTNSSLYGGTDEGNGGGVHSKSFAWNGRPNAVELYLPPLATLVFKYT